MIQFGPADSVMSLFSSDDSRSLPPCDVEGRVALPATGREVPLRIWLPMPALDAQYVSRLQLDSRWTFDVVDEDAVDSLLELCVALRFVCRRLPPVFSRPKGVEGLRCPGPRRVSARRREIGSRDGAVAAVWGPESWRGGAVLWLEEASGRRHRVTGGIAPWILLFNLHGVTVESRVAHWARHGCHLRSSLIEALFPLAAPVPAARTWLRESGRLVGHGRSDPTTLELTQPLFDGAGFSCWASIAAGRWGRFTANTPAEALGAAAWSFGALLDKGEWHADGLSPNEYSPLWSLCYSTKFDRDAAR